SVAFGWRALTTIPILNLPPNSNPMERAQKQQYEIVAHFGKQAAAMKALADLLAKVRDDDIERRNEHATAIEQLSQGQMKIAQFADSLATQYGQFSRRSPIASTPWKRRRS